MRRIRTPLLVAASTLIFAVVAPAALAEGGNPLEQRFSLTLGVYDMASDTEVRVDSLDGGDIGSRIDFERTFGIVDENVFRLEGMWRMAERHKLLLMYFESNRSGTETLEQDIEFGGETFPIAARTRGDLTFDIVELAYQYDFLKHERYELGASIGVHNVGIEVGLSASVDVGNGEVSESRSEKVDTNAPLPVLGLRGLYRLGRDFYLQAHAQYFQLKVGDYDGRIEDYQAGVLWQFSEHLGAGVAYNQFKTTVDADDEDKFVGRLVWKYDGPQLYLRLAFR